MADNFLGEVRIFAGNFAPRGWALCNGQILPISQNTALFSLIGTFYGGNGTSTFALPNFQGNMPMHQGNGAGLTPRSVGETGGEQNVTLISSQLPQHNHTVNCADSGGTQVGASNGVWAKDGEARGKQLYSTAGANTQMNPAAFSGSSAITPHNNMSPYLVLNFLIALTGIFPSRN